MIIILSTALIPIFILHRSPVRLREIHMNRIFSTILVCLFLCFSQEGNAQSKSVIKSTLEKVVMIIAMDQDDQPLGIGSGFVVSEDGEIATNYHVIEGASSAIVKFVNRDDKFMVNTIVHKNPEYDIAIIKVNAKTDPLKFGDDELAGVGEKIMAIGNPEGLEGTVSEGIISGFRKIDDNLRLIQITTPISPGSSGGPVITIKVKF